MKRYCDFMKCKRKVFKFGMCRVCCWRVYRLINGAAA